MKTPKLITTPLLERILARFKLSLIGPHGPKHWEEVDRRGQILAKQNQVNPRIVTYFAWLHDSCRLSEHRDTWHGHRAAIFVQELHVDGLITLDLASLQNLTDAIGHHSAGLTTSNVTIGTCWDADRLDLYRPGVRIQPERRLLSTEAGRHLCSFPRED